MSTTRYGRRTPYGTPGLTYGPAAAEANKRLIVLFEVDWDNDGNFDGDLNPGIFQIETETGRQNFLRGTGDGFEPVKVGTVTLQLRNHTRRYDPYFEDSPLYGNLNPGRRFRLRIWDEVEEEFYPIMKGRIDDIRPNSGEVETVTITCSNGIRQMRHAVRTEVNETIRFDEALELLLATWEDGYSIDTTVSEEMRYWWASGNSLLDEVMSVTDAALGMFCIAEDGTAKYKSRVSDDAPLVEILGTDTNLAAGANSPSPWDVVKNRIRVYARTRSIQTDVELWRLPSVLSLGIITAGTTKTIWAEYSFQGEEGVALTLTSPVSTTDYTANANSDGSGANLTAGIEITVTKFATKARLDIYNDSGVDAYMTLLKLRGNAIVADKYTHVETSDDTSIEEFGEFEFVVQSDWLQDINTAEDEANILISRLSTARRFPRITINPNPSKQFNVRLFELVSLNIASKGISGQFRAGYIKHKTMDDTLQTWTTQVYLEPNLLGNTTGAWVFPATFGTTTIF